jgi:hypothetical protein
MQALQQHQELCNELHELTLEENRFLQQHRRAPDAELLERKRKMIARLDETLAALRAAPREGTASAPFKQAVEKTRSRILQILQLDKENEQLLLRHSLAGNRAPSAPAPAPSVLQSIYQRHS